MQKASRGAGAKNQDPRRARAVVSRYTSKSYACSMDQNVKKTHCVLAGRSEAETGGLMVGEPRVPCIRRLMRVFGPHLRLLEASI